MSTSPARTGEMALMTRPSFCLSPVLCLTAIIGCSTDTSVPLDDGVYVSKVVSFSPGEGAGFGELENVLGAPGGAGDQRGSLDVLSLGIGGEIVLEIERDILDGEGQDFRVFENPFYYGAQQLFAEPAFVEASIDGVTFVPFGCEPESESLEGCAGVSPVYANPKTGIHSEDEDAGGDGFDLAEVGLARARFVRIRDAGLGGLMSPSSGFDLDAIAALHWN